MKRRYDGAVGIDLGTTTTSLAVYDEIAQKAECLCNKDGTHTLPSVVCFQESGECVIGKIAKEEYLIYPDRTMINPKKLRGKQDKSFLIDGEIVYPEDAEQYILEDVRKAAESELDQEIKEAVLAVPISFGDTERRATVKIAEAAGIHVKALIEEPVAGICHYSSLDDLNGKVCMVFDLGGGTLDISVVYVSNHQITVLAEVGEMLGGSDFDKTIEKYIREKYLREVILEADEEAQLASSVENAKIRLSQTESKSLLSQDKKLYIQFINQLKNMLEFVGYNLGDTERYMKLVYLAFKNVETSGVQGSELEAAGPYDYTQMINFLREISGKKDKEFKKLLSAMLQTQMECCLGANQAVEIRKPIVTMLQRCMFGPYKEDLEE